MDDLELGIADLQAGNFEAAARHFRRATEQNPASFDAYNNLSLCLACMGDTTEALQCAKKSVDLAPNNFMCLSNLGLLYKEVGDFVKSSEYLYKSLQFDKNPYSWSNLGLSYWEMGRYDLALNAFEEALKFDPANVNMHINIALLYLLTGNFAAGFKEYEWRLQPQGQMQHYFRCYDQKKRWDGQANLSGKRFLVYGEQGNGDVIQFARYLPKLSRMGAHVIFHCPVALNPVLKHLAHEVFNCNIETANASDLPEYDFQCCSMSLPYLLHCFEVDNKYYIGGFNRKKPHPPLKVGVSWAGSLLHPNDVIRSIPIDDFCRLFEVDGVQFFNLQLNAGEVCEKYSLIDLSSKLTDFGATADVLSSLDLVVSCDTSLVHLAGAMGFPCYVIVPTNCDWRWGVGERTPWYNSVKVFRQTEYKKWPGIIENVRQELEKWHEDAKGL